MDCRQRSGNRPDAVRKLIAGVLYEDWNRAHVVCHIAGEGNWASCREYLRVILTTRFDSSGSPDHCAGS